MDSPVGQNLQDHAAALAGPFIFPNPISNSRPISQETVDAYFLNGTGPIGVGDSMVQAVAQFASSRAIKNEQKLWPDIQLLLFAFRGEDFYENDARSLAIDETLLKEFRAPTVGKEGFHIGTCYVITSTCYR